MVGTRNTRDDQREDTDEDSVVYWLKKIYTKLDRLEEKQNVSNECLLAELKQQTVYLKSVSEKEVTHTGKENTQLNITNSNFNKTEGETSLYNENLYNTLLNKRKFAFYSKTSIPGQTQSQNECNARLEMTKVKLEIERLVEQASKEQATLESLEKQVQELISTIKSPQESQIIKEKWIFDVKREEDVSVNIWKKKKEFLERNNSIMNETSHQEKEKRNHKEHNSNAIKKNNPSYRWTNNNQSKQYSANYNREQRNNAMPKTAISEDALADVRATMTNLLNALDTNSYPNTRTNSETNFRKTYRGRARNRRFM